MTARASFVLTLFAMGTLFGALVASLALGVFLAPGDILSAALD